jgi:hypothetical protein
MVEKQGSPRKIPTVIATVARVVRVLEMMEVASFPMMMRAVVNKSCYSYLMELHRCLARALDLEMAKEWIVVEGCWEWLSQQPEPEKLATGVLFLATWLMNVNKRRDVLFGCWVVLIIKVLSLLTPVALPSK